MRKRETERGRQRKGRQGPRKRKWSNIESGGKIEQDRARENNGGQGKAGEREIERERWREGACSVRRTEGTEGTEKHTKSI